MENLATARKHTGRRQVGKLSALEVKAFVKAGNAGRLGDGGNLSLVSHTGQSFSWEFSYRQAGKARSLGLGPFPLVSLLQAREKALDARKALQAGITPESPKKPASGLATMSSRTLGSVLAEYYHLNEARWREQTRRQWQPSRCASAELLALPIEAVTRERIVAWLEIRPAATVIQVHQRLKAALGWAMDRGYVGSNAAEFKRKNFLHHAKHVVTHLAALPWQDMPKFMRYLESQGNDPPCLCLRLQILTTTRPSEAREAEWREFDLDARLWHIPALRMKGKKLHTVPLSGAALALLRSLQAIRHSDYVFPAMQTHARIVKGTLSEQTVDARLKAWPVKVTAHGFRSSFRDWCGDATDYPRELAEACLAHASGNATEQAYRRGTALEKRREVMAAWADYLSSASGAELTFPKRLAPFRHGP